MSKNIHDDYFVKETNRRLERIEEKIDILLEYRALTKGQVSVISAIVATLVSYVSKYL